MYVADTFNHTIRIITPAGVVTTLAGLAGSPGSTDATGNAARFNAPGGIAADGTGTVYVADTNNHTIRKIAPGGIVTARCMSRTPTITRSGKSRPAPS